MSLPNMEPALLTKEQAAEYCSYSVSKFDRHVRPNLTPDLGPWIASVLRHGATVMGRGKVQGSKGGKSSAGAQDQGHIKVGGANRHVHGQGKTGTQDPHRRLLGRPTQEAS